VATAPELAEIRDRVEKRVLAAVEFADNSPEPALDSLYDNLYVVDEEGGGWYAVDERTPEVHPGELEHEAHREGSTVHELAEAGAAYAGPKQSHDEARAVQDREEDPEPEPVEGPW
jgi:hypothetical protein